MDRCSSAAVKAVAPRAKRGVRRDRVARREAAGRRTRSGPGRRPARWPAGTPGRSIARTPRPGTAPARLQHPPLLEAGAPGHQSRQTWVEAVHRIIRRPGRADGVEVRLHGGVPRRGQLQRHHRRASGGRRGRRRARSRPRRGRTAAPTGSSRSRRTTTGAAAARQVQLDLPAGLEGERQGGRGPHPLDRDGRAGRGVAGQQLVLDADPGRAPVARDRGRAGRRSP